MTNVAKRLVYLDTDTQVTENIDDLCMCQGECGVVRSGFVNTGVLVVEPNLELYEEMLKQVDLIPSYNGGEQGPRPLTVGRQRLLAHPPLPRAPLLSFFPQASPTRFLLGLKAAPCFTAKRTRA